MPLNWKFYWKISKLPSTLTYVRLNQLLQFRKCLGSLLFWSLCLYLATLSSIQSQFQYPCNASFSTCLKFKKGKFLLYSLCKYSQSCQVNSLCLIECQVLLMLGTNQRMKAIHWLVVLSLFIQFTTLSVYLC